MSLARTAEGYSKVIVGIDYAGGGSALPFDVGDATNLAIRVNDVTPIDVLAPDGSTAIPVYGERGPGEGLYAFDRQLRGLIEVQNELLRRQLAILTVIAQHSIPDFGSIFAQGGLSPLYGGLDPLNCGQDEAYAIQGDR